jgi:hypothetical protein
MNKDVFARYPKERLLKGKQTFAHVKNPPKNTTIGCKTKPLSSQKVGHENGQFGVTWLEHLLVPSGMGKC